jgi:hypothetical protein
MLRARRCRQRLPMCNAPTSSAVNGPNSPVAPDVPCRGFGVALDLDRAELKINPWSTNAPAKRAVASGGDFGLGRQGHLNRATMA